MTRYHAANRFQTRLAASVDESQIYFDVESASGCPEVPFKLTVGTEIVNVIGVVGNTFTVQRGAEGTTPQGHPEGALVQNRWTAGTYEDLWDDVDNLRDTVKAHEENITDAHGIDKLSVIPSGVIVMWAGLVSDIPEGWALCDGTNGTPDLRDRFILGVSASEDPGETGGSHTKTLSTSNLPPHTHSFTTGTESRTHTHTVTGGNHTHTYQRYRDSGSVSNIWGTYPSTLTTFDTGGTGAHSHNVGNASQTHTHSGTTASTGSGTAIDIRPKYYKLAFIMKL